MATVLFPLQRVSGSARIILGVTLRPAGSALAKRIEAACGKPLDVCFEGIEQRGTSRILPDGTPLILINPSYKAMIEELLVHELEHLQLATEGFPRYDWFFDISVPPNRQDEQRQLVNWIAIHVLDPMEHRIFYPRLKRMGYHPESWRIEEMRAVIARRSFGQNLTAPEETAARYSQVAMELGEHATVRRMAVWYEQEGWSDALALGREAYSRVRDVSHWTPAAALASFVDVANVLLRPMCWTVESDGILPKHFGHVVENFGQIRLRNSSSNAR